MGSSMSVVEVSTLLKTDWILLESYEYWELRRLTNLWNILK